jgi:cytochrome c oxidase assembly factor CtaG
MDRDLRDRLRAPVRLTGPIRCAAGVALLAAAATPPFRAFTDRSLTAHMVQHLVLLQIVPLLVLSGRPLAIATRVERGRIGHAMRRMSRSGLTWAIGVSAMTGSCAPPVAMVLMDHPLAAVAGLALCGSIFWWPVIAPDGEQRLPTSAAVAYLFTACLASTITGIAIAFGTPGRYGVHTVSVGDQQLAGLVMWVPCCMVYLGAILARLARWYGGADDVRRGVAPAEA